MAQDVTMVKKDPKTISSMALTTRAVAVMALTKQGAGGVSPSHRVQLLTIIPYGPMVVPMFLLNTSRAFFLFIYKMENGNLIIGMSKSKWVH